MNIPRAKALVRIGVGLLAFESGLIAVHALLFPAYFYSDFLLGRGWVQLLPPYNEHLTRDLGALYLGFFVVLAYAAVRLTRDLVTVAMVGFIVATVPHMLFHGEHFHDAPELIDRVLQFGLLALTVALSAAILWYAGRLFTAVDAAATRHPAHVDAGAVAGADTDTDAVSRLLRATGARTQPADGRLGRTQDEPARR